MRGFVYNLPYNVNKNYLFRVKYRGALRGSRALKTLFATGSASGDFMTPEAALIKWNLYQLQTACQQLQGMQHLDPRTMLFEAVGQLHHAAGTTGNHRLGIRRDNRLALGLVDGHG